MCGQLCGECGGPAILPFSRLAGPKSCIVLDKGKGKAQPTSPKGDTMKVIINNCYGGFGIRENVLVSLGYKKYESYNYALRTDSRVIAMVESGENVGTPYSELIVATIPDDVIDWWIDEYDGLEDLWYIDRDTMRREMWEPDEDDPEDEEE